MIGADQRVLTGTFILVVSRRHIVSGTCLAGPALRVGKVGSCRAPGLRGPKAPGPSS